MDIKTINNELITFLNKSGCGELAVNEFITQAKDHGISCLDHNFDDLSFKPGTQVMINYFGNTVIGVKVGTNLTSLKFKIMASHTDCPLLKAVVNGVEEKQDYNLVTCDSYGGVLLYTWFDRPLKLVGRVMVKENDTIVSKTIDSQVAIGTIPSLAVHYQSSSELKVDPSVDLKVMVDKSITNLDAYAASLLNVDPSAILSGDYFFANAQAATIYGDYQWVQTAHLDDLMCGFTNFKGWLDASVDDQVSIFACFDGEEIGSNTLAGALSTHLRSLLEKISSDLGYGNFDFVKACNQSLVVSADNAHATSPTRSSVFSSQSGVAMNKGIVIKHSPRKAYASDAYSSALLKNLMNTHHIAYQEFENKPGVRGGGTLGTLSQRQISIPTVDIGAAQMAMHSCYEFAGCSDVLSLYQLSKVFFETNL